MTLGAVAPRAETDEPHALRGQGVGCARYPAALRSFYLWSRPRLPRHAIRERCGEGLERASGSREGGHESAGTMCGWAGEVRRGRPAAGDRIASGVARGRPVGRGGLGGDRRAQGPAGRGPVLHGDGQRARGDDEGDQGGHVAKQTFRGVVGQRISTVVTNLVTSDNPGCAHIDAAESQRRGRRYQRAGVRRHQHRPGQRPGRADRPGHLHGPAQLDQTATGSAKLWVSAPVTAGTVRVNGPAVPMNVAGVGQGVRRTFTGKAGQRISTVVTNLVTSDNPGCATLTLLNPSGGVADTSGQVCDATSIGLANAPDVLTVPGTYTVRLELDQTATGSAKLWVSAPVTAGTVRVNGPAVPMNVTRVGQGVRRTFTGKAGQRISTVVTNLVTSDNPGCATLTLLNPSGGVADTSGQV